MNVSELRNKLESHGYMFASQYDKGTGVGWYAYKTLIGAKHCVCDEKPPSLVITPYSLKFDDNVFESVEFSVRAETEANLWVDLKVYGVKFDEVLSKEDQIKKMLCASWNTIRDAN